MTETTMPQDIDDIRHAMAVETGSPLADIGSLPDASHKSSGGYHCGAFDLRAINAIGNNDYSIRQPRDRNRYYADLTAGRNQSSAIDYPNSWPKGGDAAWIRFNVLLRHQLGARDPALAAIRGINYTPNGATKRRFDCLTMTETSTTDTVLWHTHIEFWRDFVGDIHRRWAKDRLAAIARAAVTNTPLDAVSAGPTGGGSTVLYMTPDGAVYNENGVHINGSEANSPSTHNYASAVILAVPSLARVVELTTPRQAAPVDNTQAIVQGVLQGLANDPASAVTQADVDKIMAEIDKTPAATRQQFTDNPLK